MLRDSGYSEDQGGSCDTSIGGAGGDRVLKPHIPLPPMAATEERCLLLPGPPLPPSDGAEASGGAEAHVNRDSMVTGPSCLALRHAVSGLHRLDDFNREKIGTGFFSEVFKVTHRVTGQVMVLKMNLLRSNRPNMLKEVQLMNQLCHPNILGFMGACVHEGQLHALTEYMNGGSLEQLIQMTSIELTFRVREKLALDIARGMEYLHSRDVFHRDLTSKNVLIKKNETTGELTAVVGDFGLAAKIPRPGGCRLHTVGSFYWMSPECLKAQWYDQSSDVFSYGIILCELIARVEADPDVLPRTENFGLDYLAFVELCSDPPADFLKLAFSCCNFEPKNRPTFSEIVKLLERSLEVLVSSPQSALPSVVPASAANKSPGIGARSEEVLPTTESSTPQPPSSSRKLVRRRFLSDDVGLLVFPPHTAPSDKARCHFLSVASPLKHVGEEMARGDPHYKPFPSRANPFTALGQCKGVKILASTNSTDLFSSCFELPSPSPFRTDENPFDSSFEDKNKSINPRTALVLRDVEPTGCDNVDNSMKPNEDSVIVEPVVKPSHVLKYNNQNRCKELQRLSPPFVVDNDDNNNNNNNFSPSSSHSRGGGSVNNSFKQLRELKKTAVRGEQDSRTSTEVSSLKTLSDDVVSLAASVSEDECQGFKDLKISSTNDTASYRVEPPRYCTGLKAKPVSLPSSPTFSRRRSTMTVLASDLFSRFTASTAKSRLSKSSGGEEDPPRFYTSATAPLHYSVHTDPQKRVPSLFAHPLFNKTHGPHHHHHPSAMMIVDDPKCAPSPFLPPLRTCSSSSNIGTTILDDLPTSPPGLVLPGAFFHPGPVVPAGQGLRRRGSCESGFFSNLGEDFCLPGVETVTASSVTLSSSSATSSLFLDSGATVSCSLEDIATPLRGHPLHGTLHSMLQHKRSSPVYTDSSEDVSSLGGSDLPPWDERSGGSSLANLQAAPQHISKIVEYFERKQSNVSMPSSSNRWDPHDCTTLPSTFGAHHRQYHQLNHREYYQLRRCYLQQQQDANRLQTSSSSSSEARGHNSTMTSSSSSSSFVSSHAQMHRRGINQRLMICEGAVRSKLPLFDKKMSN